jgi:hypothetical protein
LVFDIIRKRWAAFRDSPCLPAVVLVFIIAIAAGLFVGSYTYAVVGPNARDIPIAVAGPPSDAAKRDAFIAGMERATGMSMRAHTYDSYAEARAAVERQQVFAILGIQAGQPELDVSSASGDSVAQVLTGAAPAVARSLGSPIMVRDINPLQRGDPRGLGLFYITLAAAVIGMIGAVQLSVHASTLRPGLMLAFTAAYAVLGGLTILAVVEWGLRTLRLPLAESWLILSLTMFATGAIFHMFQSLIGRWAMAPTWALVLVLGNPSSGGTVSWPLLPSLFATIGRWLPPGASVNAQHTAVYFGQDQHVTPFLVLLAWAGASCAVFLYRRRRVRKPPVPRSSG